jgi:hypothetical protein
MFVYSTFMHSPILLRDLLIGSLRLGCVPILVVVARLAEKPVLRASLSLWRERSNQQLSPGLR